MNVANQDQGDVDGDAVNNACDNRTEMLNPDQAGFNINGTADACE